MTIFKVTVTTDDGVLLGTFQVEPDDINEPAMIGRLVLEQLPESLIQQMEGEAA